MVRWGFDLLNIRWYYTLTTLPKPKKNQAMSKLRRKSMISTKAQFDILRLSLSLVMRTLATRKLLPMMARGKVKLQPKLSLSSRITPSSRHSRPRRHARRANRRVYRTGGRALDREIQRCTIKVISLATRKIGKMHPRGGSSRGA